MNSTQGLEFNSILWRAIREKYTTQYKFAQTVGVSPSMVSNVVNGRANLPADAQEKWSSSLGVARNLLFGDPHV